jgi:hypothetical protein
MGEREKVVKPEPCPPIGSVLARRITAREALPAVGESAKLEDLKSYISEKVAKELSRVTRGENVIDDLISPDAVAIHISFSWG